MKQAICEQTCTDWYRACKDDFFAFTPITQRLQLCDDRQMVCSPLHELASDGRDLCKQVRIIYPAHAGLGVFVYTTNQQSIGRLYGYSVLIPYSLEIIFCLI
jgi:hypothetical protein